MYNIKCLRFDLNVQNRVFRLEFSAHFFFKEVTRDHEPPDPDPQPRPLAIQRTKKEVTRKQIVSRLLWELQENSVDGKFARGALTAVGHEFHVCNKTIRRVWARALQNFQDPNIRQFRSSPLKKNCGRPKLWNHNEVRKAIKLVPLFHRRSIRDLAAFLGMA